MVTTDDRTELKPTDAAKARRLLEKTALLSRPPGEWACRLYPDAREGTLWRRLPPPNGMPEVVLEPSDDARAALAADSNRRAAGEVRRYIRANRLSYLWTFTFARAVYEYAVLTAIIDRFLDRLWDFGFRGALVLVPEPHPLGNGWHLHGAVAGFFRHKDMARLWGHGFVFVTGPRGGNRRGWKPKKLSRYLSKYLAKQLDSEELAGCIPRPKGGHRYFRTQGHEPIVERWHFVDLVDALNFIERSMGKPARMVPMTTDGGFRPEGWWMEWDDPPAGARSRAP